MSPASSRHVCIKARNLSLVDNRPEPRTTTGSRCNSKTAPRSRIRAASFSRAMGSSTSLVNLRRGEAHAHE